jgi:hypothetical protein
MRPLANGFLYPQDLPLITRRYKWIEKYASTINTHLADPTPDVFTKCPDFGLVAPFKTDL